VFGTGTRYALIVFSKDLSRDNILSQTTGQLESVESVANGDILVTFRTRSAAEQVHVYVSREFHRYSS